MSIFSEVYPECETPGKYQMEELFDSLPASYITPQVVADFGLQQDDDGEWRITVPLMPARRKFKLLYASIPKEEKVAFQLRFWNSGVKYMCHILANIADAGENTAICSEQLSTVNRDLLTQLLPCLQEHYKNAGIIVPGPA